MDIKTLDILKASEVIAVNQDPLGVPGDRVWKLGPAEVRCDFSDVRAITTHLSRLCLTMFVGGLAVVMPEGISGLPDSSRH